jgi:type II secretory pathway predicted ATPase ExeA/septal ring-binding cell division protein DamX
MSVLYRDHFEFTTDPFGITPNTDFFFGGGQRADILEALTVTIMHDEGIVMVVGEIGMGKTMLSRMLLERLKSMQVDTVYLPNPVFDRDEILNAIAKDLTGTAPVGSRAEVLGVLEPLLIQRHSEGRRVVVVIDEAHSMPALTLEEIRLLSNLETSHHKLLKIMMFGQPELEQLLQAAHLRQVRDRVSHRFSLRPLTPAEVAEYLDFRLQRAGRNRGQLFAPEAQQLLAQASGGRTRRVNMLADKSLLAAYAEGADVVQLHHAKAACAEEGISLAAPATSVIAPPGPPRALVAPGMHRWRPYGVALALGLVGLAGGWWLGRQAPGSVPGQMVAAQVSAPVPVPEAAPAPVAPPAAATPASAQAPAPLASAPATTTVSALPTTPTAVTPTAVATPAAVTVTAAVVAPQPRAQPATTADPTPVDQIVARTEALIASRAGKGFTIQVLALKAPQPAQLQDYLARFEREAGAALPIFANDRLYGGIPHHAVYVGEFETREQAQSAMDSLSASLKAHAPLIRSFARLAKEPRP